MRATLTVIIVTWSLMVIYIHHTVATNNDAGACSKSLTEEGELEWSLELGDFVLLPGNLAEEWGTGDPAHVSTPTFTTRDNPSYRRVPASEAGTLCIEAPRNHRVLLQISLKPFDAGSNRCPGCEDSCLAFQNLPPAINERPTPSPSNDQNKIGTSATVSRPTTTAADNPIEDTKINTDPVNKTVPIERYLRHSQIRLVEKRLEAEMRNNISEKKSRRKCKKCRRKRRRGERQRRRRIKFFHLVYEYAKMIFSEDPDLVRKPGVGSISAPLHYESRLKPTSSSAGEILNKIIRLHKADQRDSASRHRTNSERNKRQTPNRTSPHDNFLRTWNSSALPFLLCGLDIRQNSSSSFPGNPKFSSPNVTSHRASTFHPGVSALDSVVRPGKNVTWISLENPVNLSSIGPSLKVDALHQENWNSALLRHVRIKVSFVSSADSYRNESPFSSPNDITSTLSVSKPGESSSSLVNVSLHMTLFPVGNNPVSSVSESGSSLKTILGIAFACVSVIICLFTWYVCRCTRRRRRRMRGNPAKSVPEVQLLCEKNASPIYRSNVSTCSDPERESLTSRGIQTRQKTEGNASSAGNTTKFRDDEIKMHKCSCGKKKKLNHAGPCKEDQANRRPLAVQKCGHVDESMGLSQHRHCIVCQIAEKPHRPIMGTQYVSEFLPPASQIANTGSAIPGSPHSHTNFDKFNRMQNNPYRRHSPNLSFGRLTLPSTINLPDGEELYRHNSSSLPNSVAKRLHPEEYAATNRLGVTRYHGKTNSIKSPPNRTVFDSEGLPFLTDNQYRKSERPNGYPGPPSGICHGEHCKIGRARRAPPHQSNCALSKQREQLNYIHCLSRNEIDYTNGANASRDKCICKYILKHIKEPPPDYSDVVRDDMLTSNDKQYDVTCFGDDVTESDDVTSCEESSAHRPL